MIYISWYNSSLFHLTTFFLTSANDFILERHKERKILFEDEYGKTIVYEDSDIRIAVDDPENATYITLWHKDTKGKWVKVGYLSTSITKAKFDDTDSKKYLNVGSIDIDKKFRGYGYSRKLYQALMDFAGPDIAGLISYLPNRSNKKQVPSLYKSFGAKTIGDFQVIYFHN